MNLTSLCSVSPLVQGDTVFCFLERNPQVAVINLSSNQMPELLGESFLLQLGGRANLRDKFPSVVSLNVSDNPIVDVRAVVEELLLLMPNLRDLQMSLYRECDVDVIIQNMPKLQSLNNIAIDTDEMDREPPSEDIAGVSRPIECQESFDVS